VSRSGASARPVHYEGNALPAGLVFLACIISLMTTHHSPAFRWALNSATIMPVPWEKELRLWEQFGWRAVEVWDSKIRQRLAQGATLAALKGQMESAGVAPVGLCAGILSAAPAREQQRQEDDKLRSQLELAAALGIPMLTVVFVETPGAEPDPAAMGARLACLAAEASTLPVRLGLEFLGKYPVNGTLISALDLVKRAGHRGCGVVLDLCHHFVSLPEHADLTPSLAGEKLFLVHIDDAPREIPFDQLPNDRRCCPGEGRIGVAPLLHHIRTHLGYDGYYSVELYDQTLWSQDPESVLGQVAGSLDALTRELEAMPV